MTRLVDRVLNRAGVCLGIRCARCGVVFGLFRRGAGDTWRWHSDHTWECAA